MRRGVPPRCFVPSSHVGGWQAISVLLGSSPVGSTAKRHICAGSERRHYFVCLLRNLHRQTLLIGVRLFVRGKASSQQVGRPLGIFSFSGVTIMLGIFRFAAVSFCLIFAPLLHAQTSGPLAAAPSFNLAGQSAGAAKQRPK